MEQCCKLKKFVRLKKNFVRKTINLKIYNPKVL